MINPIVEPRIKLKNEPRIKPRIKLRMNSIHEPRIPFKSLHDCGTD